MANYLSLEEAAARLGITTDRLVELRSQGQLRGFRDGSSWKFPDTEIDRLKDELADLVSDAGSAIGSVIGGDPEPDDGSGSDLGIGGETLQPGSGDSDVNLVASTGEGSDVELVASDGSSDADLGSDFDGSGIESDFDESGALLEIDSGELQLEDPAMHRQPLDLAVEPNAGSTGPVTDDELKEISESHPDVLAPDSDMSSAGSDMSSSSGSLAGSGAMLDIGGEVDDMKLSNEGDLSFAGSVADEDSGEELISADDSGMEDVLGGDLGLSSSEASSGASSLELMDQLDSPSLSNAEIGPTGSSKGNDVLSELDLLSEEQQDSGLIRGDSENLLSSSGLGSSIGADSLAGSDLSSLEADDALAEDDDLVIADDDDDLMIGSSQGSDISIAGDSGINLMSPSDSGLSLESEPLDLAGSSISALDLGAELSEGGSSGSGGGAGSSGAGSDGSAVDFQADEEFQLSPSGVDLEADSGSQVIEVEDSEAIAEPVEFGDAFGDDSGMAFGEPVAEVGDALALDEGAEVAIDETEVAPVTAAAAIGGYEVPFTILQCIVLVFVICMLSLSGMLMTDLVRNMWAYSEPSAPVSSLTDSLIGLMGW